MPEINAKGGVKIIGKEAYVHPLQLTELEFLLTIEAQEHIVNNSYEYPMIKGVKTHDLVAQMGLGFKQDLKTKVANYGSKQADALEIMLSAKWK